MGWFSKLIEGAVGGSGAGVVDFFAKRQTLKQELALAKLAGEIEIEKAKAAYRVKDLEYDAQWELAQIQNSGWKDEYVLVLLSIPFVLVFVPFAQPYVLEGFAVLEKCPDWYRWLILVIFTAVYGVRIWRREGAK